jgi:hypothetical protein
MPPDPHTEEGQSPSPDPTPSALRASTRAFGPRSSGPPRLQILRTPLAATSIALCTSRPPIHHSVLVLMDIANEYSLPVCRAATTW